MLNDANFLHLFGVIGFSSSSFATNISALRAFYMLTLSKPE